jgi:outer membrane lipoprotein carrier protein
LALSVSGAEVSLSQVLGKIEKRYNRAKTLQVFFQQTYSIQGRNRRTESGELFLRKPGRMRWEYESPKGKLFVSDGKYIYLYSPVTNRVEKMGMRETADMRAPLAFLLGRLDFWRDFDRFVSRPDGADLRVTAEPKSDQLPYTKVEFVVTPSHEIRYLQITGQDHSIMEFTFTGEKLNSPLKDSLFQFEAPPGAEVVDTAEMAQGTQ